MNKHYRQGDLLFVKCAGIPKGGNIRPNGHILEGEATGHVHRIAVLEDAEVVECGDGLFLRAGVNGVSIVHEDHGTMILPPGNYEVVRQREYQPDAIRNVAD